MECSRETWTAVYFREHHHIVVTSTTMGNDPKKRSRDERASCETCPFSPACSCVLTVRSVRRAPSVSSAMSEQTKINEYIEKSVAAPIRWRAFALTIRPDRVQNSLLGALLG
jgi:hypothetical protein